MSDIQVTAPEALVKEPLPMLDHLLHVVSVPPTAIKKGIPMMLELPVADNLAPYLVSSTKALFWQNKTVNGFIRVAVRRSTTIPSLYREILTEIAVTGTDVKWENVYPVSAEGVVGAIAHVKSYGIGECVMLASEKLAASLNLPLALQEMVLHAEWLPDNVACVIPKERDLLGSLLSFGNESFAVLVHNPSRAIAILSD